MDSAKFISKYSVYDNQKTENDLCEKQIYMLYNYLCLASKAILANVLYVITNFVKILSSRSWVVPKGIVPPQCKTQRNNEVWHNKETTV